MAIIGRISQEQHPSELLMMHFLKRPRLAALPVAVLAVVLQASPAFAGYTATASPSWVPNGTVYSMARSGNTVYLGGDFTALTDPRTNATVSRAHLAAVDAATGVPLSTWNPGANGSVRALAVGSNGTVYAGGSFTTAAGVAASRLAAITPTGRAVSGWRATANNTVRDIAVDGTSLYVAGAFGTLNGISRPRVAKLSAGTGSIVSSFNAQVAGGTVYAIARTGTSLLLGGSFTTLSGKSRPFSGSVSASSGAVTSWAPAKQCDSCPVLDIATDGTKAYEAIGGSGNRATAFSLSSGARAWSKVGDGDVQAIAVLGGIVYAGGHFSYFTGLHRRQLVPLSASSGALQSDSISFTGSDYPGVWAIEPSTTELRIAGGFQLTNNPAARYAVFASS